MITRHIQLGIQLIGCAFYDNMEVFSHIQNNKNWLL